MRKQKKDVIYISFIISIILIVLYGMKIINNFYIATIPIIGLVGFMYVKYIFAYHKINTYLLTLICILFLSILFREYTDFEQLIFYVVVLLSPLAFSVISWDKNKIKTVCKIFALASLITPLFNGFLSGTVSAGKAFDGRLLPFFYIIFSLLGIKYNESFKSRMLYYIAIIFNLYGIIWSGSRITMIATGFLIIISSLAKKFRITNTTKKILIVLYIIIILLQILIPYTYIFLSEKFDKELNQLSYNITGKKFFTGREILWNNIIEDINENFLVGTSDTNYENHKLTAHNEIIGRAYIWGGLSTIFLIFYNYKILKKCIKNIDEKNEKFIIFGIFAIIICSCFEIIMYTPTGFIYYNILVAILLSKGDKIDEV